MISGEVWLAVGWALRLMSVISAIGNGAIGNSCSLIARLGAREVFCLLRRRRRLSTTTTAAEIEKVFYLNALSVSIRDYERAEILIFRLDPPSHSF